MAPETLFAICNNGVLPFWLLLIVAPGWKWTQSIVHAVWIPLVLAMAYGFAIVTSFVDPPAGGSFGSLAGVMAFFTSPWAALAGWIHYLAFDLFIGAWEVRDARRRTIHHGFVIPCLVFTLALGPIGLGLYAIVRLVARRASTLDEALVPAMD